jgi:hypothetical protein
MARALGVDSVTLYLPSYGAMWSGVEQSLRDNQDPSLKPAAAELPSNEGTSSAPADPHRMPLPIAASAAGLPTHSASTAVKQATEHVDDRTASK